MTRMLGSVRRWVKLRPWYYVRDDKGRGAQRAREEREWRRQELPDQDRIAVLEHELVVAPVEARLGERWERLRVDGVAEREVA